MINDLLEVELKADLKDLSNQNKALKLGLA